MKLYAVVTIYENTFDDRCVGVFSTLEIARDIVERNALDIYERSYKYAVIEEKEIDHLYPHGGEQYWYEWQGDPDTGKYVSCERPDKYKNTSGFGIG